MTNFVTSIAVDDVIEALITYLTPFVGGAKIVRAQTNRVAMPPNPCLVLTELFSQNLSMPRMTFEPLLDTATLRDSVRITIQIDFYGQDAGDQCRAVKNTFSTVWGYDQFPENIRPLYADEGRQMPLITGEEQYESRWTVTVQLQYNPNVSVPQDFAAVLTPTVHVPVDLTPLL